MNSKSKRLLSKELYDILFDDAKTREMLRIPSEPKEVKPDESIQQPQPKKNIKKNIVGS